MNNLSALPSVDLVLRQLAHLSLPHQFLRQQVRAVLADRRQGLRSGESTDSSDIAVEVERRLSVLLNPSLRPVINATGVILHTNLGRAPIASFQPISRYSNLEYDLATGKRGKRDVHTAQLLEALLHRPAILVNNNAAAVYLTLNELAAGQEVIVSRGELIEIGDGFRIPDIMARSGAILREVGTTNRTRIEDYAEAITDRTRLIMRVHPSNFQVSGFTARPKLSELSRLGRERGLVVYEDLGSGCLVDLRSHGIVEPLVNDSLEAGVNVVSFSCDKLLGGPQTGIIAGDAEWVTRIRRNPMFRALRVDKLAIEALETTLRCLLREQWSAIPTLQMIMASSEAIRSRAERIASQLSQLNPDVVEDESPIGGGSTPDQVLPTFVLRLRVPDSAAFERALRSAPIPVIGRIAKGQLLLDMRTVADEEEEALLEAVRRAASL